ncbi:MAG TPA: hypothetical protein VJJ23_06170 [Candidatus Nanoarchaeia archaeon]|nr:hypothetical protein [Candidatus Nanoarchaeia archaeon]
MNLSSKTLGSILIGFSLILIFLLTFVKINLDSQSEYLCELTALLNKDMKQCPAHNNIISWIIVSAFGIGFILFGVGVYMLFSSKPIFEGLKKDFKQIDLSKLDNEEKKIYEVIKNKNGSAYQTDLIKESEFSKVKITRILDRLESKGVLERKRRGMTNIVVLK